MYIIINIYSESLIDFMKVMPHDNHKKQNVSYYHLIPSSKLALEKVDERKMVRDKG